MSSSNKTIPKDLDFETFRTLSKFDEPTARNLFDTCKIKIYFNEIFFDLIYFTLFYLDKSENGLLTREKLINLNELTDCFLTHDWGIDQYGRNNHDRVSRINEDLKKRGFITWFDSDRMIGNIVAQMTSGIDNCQFVIVFITLNYIQKVGGTNSNDNCRIEFNYAQLQLGGSKMIPVVMEERVRDTKTWKGTVGGTMNYY
jgi:hypothetical protein